MAAFRAFIWLSVVFPQQQKVPAGILRRALHLPGAMP
jgi:hypothetical protein